MTRVLRPLMIVVAFLFMFWVPSSIPGLGSSLESSGASSSGVSIGTVVKMGFRFSIFAAFVVGGIIGGKGLGLLDGLHYLFGAKTPLLQPRRQAAHDALLGATRGLLWSSFLVLAFYDLQAYLRVFWRTESQVDSFTDVLAAMDFVRVGGYVMLPFLVLVLVPSTSSLADEHSTGRAWLRRLDVSCLLGYAGLAFVFPLSLLVLRTETIGVEGSARYWIGPRMNSVDFPFLAWCSLVMGGLLFAAMVPRREGKRRLPWNAGPFSFDFYILAVGALTSCAIRVGTFQNLGNSLGDGNSLGLQLLGGRMLVPLVLALGLIGVRRMLALSVEARLKSALE